MRIVIFFLCKIDFFKNKILKKSLRSYSLKFSKNKKGVVIISNKTNQYLIQEALEELAQSGINQLKDSLTKLLNQLMLAEREEFVNSAPYERSDIRKDQCNGFKNKKLLTRCGELDLKVPQV